MQTVMDRGTAGSPDPHNADKKVQSKCEKPCPRVPAARAAVKSNPAPPAQDHAMRDVQESASERLQKCV